MLMKNIAPAEMLFVLLLLVCERCLQNITMCFSNSRKRHLACWKWQEGISANSMQF